VVASQHIQIFQNHAKILPMYRGQEVLMVVCYSARIVLLAESFSRSNLQLDRRFWLLVNLRVITAALLIVVSSLARARLVRCHLMVDVTPAIAKFA
jgi:hypothetical protein